MKLFLMQAMTMNRIQFITTVNNDFREWAKENGAHSGIAMGLPTKTTGLPMTRVAIMESNLDQFNQKFDCACGFQTHIAGQFWDHCHFKCPILKVINNGVYGHHPQLERKEHGTDERKGIQIPQIKR